MEREETVQKTETVYKVLEAVQNLSRPSKAQDLRKRLLGTDTGSVEEAVGGTESVQETVKDT